MKKLAAALLMIIFLPSCALFKEPTVIVRRPPSVIERLEVCTDKYIGYFGVQPDKAIVVCEKIHRGN